MFFLILLSGPAVAAVITFDDITGVPGNSHPHIPLGFVPSGYEGFQWGAGINIMKEDTFTDFYNNSSSFPSYDQALTNNGTDIASIFSSTPFDFLGGSFIAWGRDDLKDKFTSTSIEFRFYRGSSLVGPSPTFDLLTDQFRTIHFSESWVRGINRVEMIASSYGTTSGITTSWIMDNMVYDREPGNSNTVPEPSTAVLFLAGILSLSGLARKK